MKISPIDVSRSQAKERKLLPHQEEALAALDGYFVLGQKAPQKGLLVMPTGSGKNFTAVTWLLDRAVPNGYMVFGSPTARSWWARRTGCSSTSAPY